MMRIARIIVPLICCLSTVQLIAQGEQSWGTYDFVAGEKIIFDDTEGAEKVGAVPALWKITGGAASVKGSGADRCISIDKYYTSLVPKTKTPLVMGSRWTIEFDYWLDAGYDGNPGVQLSFMQKAEVAVIVPNRNDFTVQLKTERIAHETPAALFSDAFYNKWIHIALAYQNNSLSIYADQFKVMTIPQVELKGSSILVKGDQSSGMKMLFRNFRVAEGGGSAGIAEAMNNGHFVTHGIRFDVGTARLQNSSAGVLSEVARSLKADPSMMVEISGHTDSDGDEKANLILSQQRADAVRERLIELGVSATQLSTKGFGEAQPISDNKTAEGKANNRRVEFVKR